MLGKNLTRSKMEDNTKITKMDFEPLSKEVVDIAYKIHQTMGSGLLECIYEDCFIIELEKRKISYEKQKRLPIQYEGKTLPSILKLDLIIDNKIIVELKSVEKIIPAHTAQILTYMRLSNCKTGLLINFGEPYFKQAIKRFVL